MIFVCAWFFYLLFVYRSSSSASRLRRISKALSIFASLYDCESMRVPVVKNLNAGEVAPNLPYPSLTAVEEIPTSNTAFDRNKKVRFAVGGCPCVMKVTNVFLAPEVNGLSQSRRT